MKYRLPLTVAITGSAVLIVEVVAVRVLAPFFGNTIFTFSSVISVILGALSAGYWVGGNLADRDRSYELFYRIIIVGGLTIYGGTMLARILLPVLGLSLSLTWGPLLSSIFFFAAPAFFLGMLSPYAVALAEEERGANSAGKASGVIFFWSTLGSIAGSLGAGFVLLPRFSTYSILYGTSIALMILGVVGLRHWSRAGANKICAVIVLFVGSSLFLISQLDLPSTVFTGTVRHSEGGLYSDLMVLDTMIQGRPARVLLQDRSMSSGMDLETGDLAFAYTEYYKLAGYASTSISRALILGGGALTMAKTMAQELPTAQIDVVDIEPALPRIAKDWFSAGENPHVHFEPVDARRFLEKSDNRYDLIFGDVYQSFYSIPSHLVTEEFFDLVKRRLSPDGIFVMNVVGTLEADPPSVLGSVLHTMKRVFPNVELFAVQNPKNVHELQNFIVLASMHPGSGALPQKEHLVGISGFDFHRHVAFTDDFAPVEYYGAGLISQAR